MARPVTWGIRITLSDGRTVMVRENRNIGQGRIATFRTKEQAEAEADYWRPKMPTVTVFERSHGRQFPSAGESKAQGSASLDSERKS